MRNMAFSLTTAQVRAGTKDITRRIGWTFLKPGDQLMACVKCMGRRKGEPLERIRPIEVVSVRREMIGQLNRVSGPIGFEPLYRQRHQAETEVRREGFEGHSPAWFVEMF